MEAGLPIWLLTALVGALVWLVGLWAERRRRRSPPGPLPWPIVGNLLQLGTLPHQSLAKLAQRHGPLMSLRLGSRPALVVSSPQLAEELLRKQDQIWSARCHSVVGDLMFYGSRDLVYGPRWKLFRTILTQELLTVKRVTDFKKAREDEVLRGIGRAVGESADGRKSVEIAAVLRGVSLNIMMRMLVNEGMGGQALEQTTEGFADMVPECIALIGAAHLGDFFPCLAPFDIQGFQRRMRSTAQKLDGFFHRILEDHRRKLPTKVRAKGFLDLVDAMLLAGVEGKAALDDSEMKGLMQNFILGGTHTTSSSIEWALSELLRNPASMAKLRAEIDSVVGRDRLVDESDLPNLPYLEAVTKEALRLHPIAPMLIPHASTEGSEVGGFEFPAGTQLFVNVYAIQRDPKVWERALEFDPDRFLGAERRDLHGRDFELLPFGSGRRICPGKGLALILFQYILALLVQTCDVGPPGASKPEELDMEECYELAMTRVHPLEIVLTPRSSYRMIERYLEK